ncbi:MAG: sugar-binding domain-containing protein, partial [Halorhabdus sp.]
MTSDSIGPSGGSATETIDLAGEWRFSTDTEETGVESNWAENSLEGAISLPGTTDEAGVGDPAAGRDTHHLTRTRRYEGTAWYQRTVEIPQDWRGRRVTLFLERSRKTTLWVDDTEIGTRHSLSTPHEYDLTGVVDPGAHTLTIRVDNGSPPVTFDGVQKSHQATVETQTNWNGILGDLRLRATDPVWIDDVRVTFGDDGTNATVELDVGNQTGEQVTGYIRTRVLPGSDDVCGSGSDSSEPPTESVHSDISIESGESSLCVELGLTGDEHRWDEFDPGADELIVELRAKTADGEFEHATAVPLGRCDFEVDGTQFSSNGRTTFLRGTV